MLHYFRFSDRVPAPVPAREVYEKPGPGQGWPSQCPPLRAANAFGWDVLAAFEMTFRQRRDGTWVVEDPVDLESDWRWSADMAAIEGHDLAGRPRAAEEEAGSEGEEDGVPVVQRNAWCWERGQTLPHPISDEAFETIKNQVKVSTYLFLATDPNELLYVTDVPNLHRPYRALTAVVDTDWYPASYPWHCVLELDRREKKILIPAGDPICRIVPVRRDFYVAREMDEAAFETYFERSQAWLLAHARGEPGPLMDIRGQYAKQQERARFRVLP